jgi:hypothetical protein
MIRFFKSAPKNAGFLAAINFSCYKGKGRFWIDLVGQTDYNKEKRVPIFKGSNRRVKLSLNENEASSLLRVLRKDVNSFPSSGKPAYHSTNKGTTMFSFTWYEAKGTKGLGLSVTQKSSDENVSIKAWFNEDECVLIEEYLVAGLHKFFNIMMDEERDRIISSYKKNNEQQSSFGHQDFFGGQDSFTPPTEEPAQTETPARQNDYQDEWDDIANGNTQQGGNSNDLF